MKITKHAHACVVVTDGPHSVLVDPGTLTANAAQLIAETTAILITHDHLDHVDVALVAAALAAREDLTVYAPDAVIVAVSEAAGGAGLAGSAVAVAAGDSFVAAGLSVEVFGTLHAEIHPDVPRSTNVGYLIGGRVFHPGDSYDPPGVEVELLLLPTSGPWNSTRGAIDYVRAVNPLRCIQIHESMATEVGQRNLAARIQPGVMTDVALELVPNGESVEL